MRQMHTKVLQQIESCYGSADPLNKALELPTLISLNEKLGIGLLETKITKVDSQIGLLWLTVLTLLNAG